MRLTRLTGRSRTTVSVILGIALSRLFGFVRERVVAHYFGVSGAVDALNAAYRLPNLFRNLLGEGSLSVSLIPILSEYLATGREKEARRLATILWSALVALLIALTGLGLLLAPTLARVMAPGFDPARQTLTITLVRILFPVCAFTILAAWAMGIYHAHGRFLVPALSPILFSLAQILSVVFLASRFEPVPIRAVAWGMLVGGLLHFAVHLPGLLRLKMGPGWDLTLTHPGFRAVVRLFLPLSLAVGVAQINALVDLFLASFLKEGAVAALAYASRLYLLPLGLFGTSVAMVALPSLAREAVAADPRIVRQDLLRSWQETLFLTWPASLAFIFFGQPMVRLVFETGNFGAAETRLVTGVLQLYAVGLVAYTSVKLLATGYYALQDTRTPFKVSLLAVGLNTLLSFVLMQVLEVRGIALGTALAAFLNVGLLARGLHQRLGPLWGGGGLRWLGRLVLAGGLMVAVGWGWQALWPSPPQAGFGGQVVEVGLLISVMAGSYLGCGRLLGLWPRPPALTARPPVPRIDI